MPAEHDNGTVPSPVIEYARLLRELHALSLAGKQDSAEAEAVIEQMDAPWASMSGREQERMGGLSEDLYAVQDCKSGVSMTDQQVRDWQEKAKLVFESGEITDADVCLAFLRQPSPDVMPGETVPFLQARCWEKLGDLETAYLFLTQAESRDPTVDVCVVALLQRMGRNEEAGRHAQRVLERNSASPTEIYYAATAQFSATRSLPKKDATHQLNQVIAHLRRAQKKLASSQSDEGPSAHNLAAMIIYSMGFANEQLGLTERAIKIYDEGLKQFPRDPDLLLARGLVVYPEQINESLRFLVSATKAGSQSIWPWLIVARHSLLADEYGDAYRYALEAMRRPGPPRARAWAYEAFAIAQAMLGQNQDWVVENFKVALDLDPNNKQIQENYNLAKRQRESRKHSSLWKKQLTIAAISENQVRKGVRQEVDEQADRILPGRKQLALTG